MFDETIWNHIGQLGPCLRGLLRRPGDSAKSVHELYEWINKVVHNYGTEDSSGQTYVGVLKHQGRKPTFGFLIDQFGVETFVARVKVPDQVWSHMEQDGLVGYCIRKREDGRTEAFDVDFASE